MQLDTANQDKIIQPQKKNAKELYINDLQQEKKNWFDT